VNFCFEIIVLVQIIEVAFNLLVDLLDEGIEFPFGVVSMSAVYSFELTAINGDEFSAE